MKTTFPFGRVLYAVAIVSFGVELLVARTFPVGLFPLPAVFSGRLALVISLGVVLTLAGLSILTRRKADLASRVVGIVWLLTAVSLHAPALVSNLYNGSKWTVFSELVALGGGSFFLAGELGHRPDGAMPLRFNWTATGRFLFAGSLVVFGVLHFVYAAFIATLIPAWIPGRLFWAYFVGVAFVATAVSLLIRKQMPVSTNLLGLMFILWVVGLHAPRVMASPQIEPEWTSMFIALAMSGISFTMARQTCREERTVSTQFAN